MLKIGIVGHRNLDKRCIEAYKKQVFEKLSELKQKHHDIMLLSPLADGADRLAVYEAMKLNISYIAVLPIPKECYEDDFNRASKIEFEKLLNRADAMLTLSAIEPFHRDMQYEAAGKYISDTSDILLALWDGEENHLQGGTSETVKYHLKNKKALWHLKVVREVVSLQ